MMGIEELNDFKGNPEKVGEDWFFDNLIKSGVNFDGAHWHACKTPLGREEGYYKVVEGKEKLEACASYELIGTAQEFMKFQADEWYKEDLFLAQALSNIVLVSGNLHLIENYQDQLLTYKESIEEHAFETFKTDAEKFNPFNQIANNKSGELFNVKKDIYRFSDRIITALRNILGDIEENNWAIRYLAVTPEGQKIFI